MCGIIGGYGCMDSESASRMLACVVHMGPDDEGRIEVAGNMLGHRRLSIIDVEGGKQPLVGSERHRGRVQARSANARQVRLAAVLVGI
jgi:asparagine synthase (glutamine-hydrolysing)